MITTALQSLFPSSWPSHPPLPLSQPHPVKSTTTDSPFLFLSGGHLGLQAIAWGGGHLELADIGLASIVRLCAGAFAGSPDVDFGWYWYFFFRDSSARLCAGRGRLRGFAGTPDADFGWYWYCFFRDSSARLCAGRGRWKGSAGMAWGWLDIAQKAADKFLM
jgi:hypothetical protein